MIEKQKPQDFFTNDECKREYCVNCVHGLTAYVGGKSERHMEAIGCDLVIPCEGFERRLKKT